MDLKFWKKKPEWVKNLEEERETLSSTLKELDGLGASHEMALQRIQMINETLRQAGYGSGSRGVSPDTKATLLAQIGQTIYITHASEILGKIFRSNPFQIKPKMK
jgi:hypothetical protein